MSYHHSFRAIQKKKLHARAMKGVEARRAKMLEVQPDYPLDRNELCYRHAVIFSEIGKPVKRVYELLKINEHERIHYWLYVNGRKAGVSTHKQLLDRIGRNDFPRIGHV